MDLAPTILGLLGVEYTSAFFGRDLFRLKPKEGYALVQHDRDVGFFNGEKLAILSTRKTSNVYRYDAATKRFSAITAPTVADNDLKLNAISLYQSAYDLYSHGDYTITPNK
jgi:phosphoglycerol transferase MdoB-like AlkP superfamily enzyme